jgi:hypothetical protein
LDGVKAKLKAGEIIGVSQGNNKGRYCIQWIGQEGTPMASQVGVVSVTPEKNIWDATLPATGVDTFIEQPQPRSASERRQLPDRRQAADRRWAARMKCVISVQILPAGQTAPIWGKAIDMSMGGCFIEMPIPLQKGTKLTLGLWVKENKLHATGRVVSSRPGFGIGVQFAEMSELDTAQLKDFLRSITQIPL